MHVLDAARSLPVPLCVHAEGAAAQQEDAGDGAYASEESATDDEATLEEEDALAAQEGTDRKVPPAAPSIGTRDP